MKKVIIIIIVVLSIFQIRLGHAQLILDRSYVRKTVAPGETVAESMALHNTSDKGMTIKVYWQDFNYIEPYDGAKEFYPVGASAYSMGDWVSFSPKEFNLPPQTRKIINFSINVPEDASGGHYGVLFFEIDSAKQESESMALSIVTRLGSLFFINTIGSDKTSKVYDIHLKGDHFEGTFQNLGDVILLPEGTYYILNTEGYVEDRGEINKMYLPPGKETTFQLATENTLKEGRYTAVITFDLKEGDTIVREIDFNIDSFGQKEITEIRN